MTSKIQTVQELRSRLQRRIKLKTKAFTDALEWLEVAHLIPGLDIGDAALSVRNAQYVLAQEEKRETDEAIQSCVEALDADDAEWSAQDERDYQETLNSNMVQQ